MSTRVNGRAGFCVKLILLLLISGNVSGQCDTTIPSRKVMDAVDLSEFVFDVDRKDGIKLKADLDREAMRTIKAGLSKSLFIRQVPLNGKIGFDTIILSDKEHKELDSVLAKRTFHWNNAKEAACKLNLKVEIYKKIPGEDHGFSIPRLQIMEPVLIRNNTIAFTFYKSEPIVRYGELSIYTYTVNGWKRWDRILILLDYK